MKITLFLLLNLLFFQSLMAQVNIEAIQHFNGSSGSSDEAVKILYDGNGSIYVAGHSYDEFTAFITLSKFNASGNLIWRQLFSSKNNGEDGVVTAGLDSTGNIIIGANSLVNNSNYDILLVKYDPNGIRLWQKTYNGSGNSSDLLTSLAIDASGNIYAAGQITIQSKDIGLIKYDRDGNLLWERFYNGNANAEDTPGEICLDRNNNVYMTGQTYTSEFTIRAIAFKYSSTGNLLWSNVFIGTSSRSSCLSLALDKDMNLFTAGFELTSINSCYLILKYSPEGALLWNKSYLLDNQTYTYRCEADKIKTDSLGNAYVTGTAFPIITDNNFVTGIVVVKYNSSGDTVWTSKFNRGDYVNRNMTYLHVAGPGKIYVASYIEKHPYYRDMLLYKLNSDGSIQWQFTEENSGDDRLKDVISDPQGNVYTCGLSNKNGVDLIALKFSESGDLQWESSYNSQGFGEDNFSNMATDRNGNIIVYGHNVSENILVKYDRFLNMIWAKTFIDSADGSGPKSSRIICDSSGNIYASNIMSANGQINIRVFKFSYSGEMLWSAVYPSSGSSIIAPKSLTIDMFQNLTIMGQDYNTSSLDFRILLLKYSPDGSLILNRIHNNSTAQNSDRAERMIMDEKNHMYVVGSNGGNVLILKFDRQGNQIWERTYAEGPYVKSLGDLTLDRFGNLFTCGFIGEAGQGYNYLVLKFDSQGNQSWVRTYNGLRNGDDYARGVLTDSTGNVYVTGEARNYTSNFSSSITTIKYDTEGNSLWMRNINGIGFSSLSPSSFAIDKFSNFYVLNGYRGHNLTSYLAVKYKPNGDSVWSFSYPSPDNVTNTASAIFIDNSNNVFISGKAYGVNTSFDITTIKLSQMVGVIENNSGIPIAFSLSQNYPNPFNPSTIINYQLPIFNFVSLKVYDALGKEVATLVNEKQNSGRYEVEFNGEGLPSGIYFYKLEESDFVETKKMIYLK